jgi:cell division protease FtsH
MSKEKLHADLAVAMGGRIAEEMIFGAEKVTTGASSDIKMATEMSRRMVMEWGMSESLGPINYGSDREEVFLGYQMGQQKNMSADTANKVDAEVKRIVEDAYTRAKGILTEYRNELETLAKALLEYETLDGTEIPLVLKGQKLNRGDDDGSAASAKKKGKSGSVPTAGGVDLGAPEPLSST